MLFCLYTVRIVKPPFIVANTSAHCKSPAYIRTSVKNSHKSSKRVKMRLDVDMVLRPDLILRLFNNVIVKNWFSKKEILIF